MCKSFFVFLYVDMLISFKRNKNPWILGNVVLPGKIKKKEKKNRKGNVVLRGKVK